MTLRSTCLLAGALLAGALLALAATPLANAAARTADASGAFCAQDPKALKGEERERHAAECARPLGNQQNKMKTCNAEAKAKDLHGDERRAFMSTCLKG